MYIPLASFTTPSAPNELDKGLTGEFTSPVCALVVLTLIYAVSLCFPPGSLIVSM